MNKKNNKIIFFISLLVVIYIYPFYRIVQAGGIDQAETFVILIMWAPAISAIVTKLIFDKNLRGLGLGFGKFKYLLLSLILPIIAAIIVYPIVWISGIGALNFDKLDSFLGVWLITIIIGLLSSMLTATGEELGWRGFLVPELAKGSSYTRSSLILAVIWNIYHYPVLLFGGYNNGESIVLSLIFFSISVTAVCFITGWIRLKTNSFWGAAIFHASHNFFIQSVFDEITITKSHTTLFTTEFGIGLCIVYVIIAFLFWLKRHSLEIPAAN